MAKRKPEWTDEGKADFHGLRTAFATMILEGGANLKETQSLMRHADPNITMNTYARSRNARLTSIAESVSDRIGLTRKCAIGVQRNAVGDYGFGVKGTPNETYATIKMVVLRNATNRFSPTFPC
ncbi:MAG TPA: hypothetical protein EYN96_00985 [Candidatus Hydrogenedentes bacterium]|nr:hypothetical protein [Candidatus Hydrogenedentota bacterium]